MKARTTGWHERTCPNALCTVDTLVVMRSLHHDDLWWVAREVHDAPWQVAAVAPICPFCATTLVATVSWEDEGLGVEGEGEARVA